MTIEGRYRFPINVRYPSELRDDPEKIFPSLKGENLQQLADELDSVIQQAQCTHVTVE